MRLAIRAVIDQHCGMSAEQFHSLCAGLFLASEICQEHESPRGRSANAEKIRAYLTKVQLAAEQGLPMPSHRSV